MIKVSGYRILVKTQTYVEHDPVVAAAKRMGLEVVLDSQTRYDASVDKGVVVAVGPDAWSNCKEPWAYVGDTIVFARNSGVVIEDPEDKESRYVVINDEDTIAVIKE